MTKENAIRYYRKFSGADRYFIGFIYDGELYLADVPELLPRFLYVGVNSSSRGGGEKLRMRIYKKDKELLIRKGAIHLGSEDLIQGRNKGTQLENLIYKMNGQTPRNGDSTRFDKCGDININGIEYQVKFENASVVDFSTLKNIQKERRKSA